MKMSRVPLALLVLLYIGFFSFVAASVPQLPATVATHFGGSGRPNGWMSQRGYAIFIVVFAWVIPTLIVGSCALIRVLPKRAVNIPHRDHWLAAERIERTCADLFR